ncbi:hypothetical protein CDL15_Pgr003524 [Punica granatum]|nr:hypothetical protein CDL15_Pgr003524 [Punica granatum]
MHIHIHALGGCHVMTNEETSPFEKPLVRVRPLAPTRREYTKGRYSLLQALEVASTYYSPFIIIGETSYCVESFSSIPLFGTDVAQSRSV